MGAAIFVVELFVVASLSSVYSQNPEGGDHKGTCLREMPQKSWEISPLATQKAGVHKPTSSHHSIWNPPPAVVPALCWEELRDYPPGQC